MASSKVSREKLKRSGSFQKKEPPPPPPDENQFPDVKLEDFEMLKTIGQRCMLNLSRDETSSRWCGVVVRRGGASSGVVHVT
ncbi:hypothetical protein TNCV_1805191 [Trichonephila clavipes]|nr:hypothetical protein TNCV_1805191 [Trichonephila clavipes]